MLEMLVAYTVETKRLYVVEAPGSVGPCKKMVVYDDGLVSKSCHVRFRFGR
jgi:hypothetical protein